MRDDPRRQRNLMAGLQGFFGIQSGGSLSAILLIFLGPFVVTLEVFLRKNMGERYFNRMNFLAGWFVLSILSLISGFTDDAFLGLIFMGYLGMSGYHFFIQWWQNKTRQWVHSMNLGDSRLEWLGGKVIGLINSLLAIPVKFLSKALPESEQQKIGQALPIFKDVRTLTYTFVEPFFFIFLAFLIQIFGSSVTATWLFLSAIALMASNSILMELSWHQLLNIRDSRIESEYMRGGMPEDSGKIKFPDKVRNAIKEFAEEAKEEPQLLADIEMASPSIADAMAAINAQSSNEESKNDAT